MQFQFIFVLASAMFAMSSPIPNEDSEAPLAHCSMTDDPTGFVGDKPEPTHYSGTDDPIGAAGYGPRPTYYSPPETTVYFDKTRSYSPTFAEMPSITEMAFAEKDTIATTYNEPMVAVSWYK